MTVVAPVSAASDFAVIGVGGASGHRNHVQPFNQRDVEDVAKIIAYCLGGGSGDKPVSSPIGGVSSVRQQSRPG